RVQRIVVVVVPEPDGIERRAVGELKIAPVGGDLYEAVRSAVHYRKLPQAALRRTLPIARVNHVPPRAGLRGREPDHPKRVPVRWVIESPDLPHAAGGRCELSLE